MSFGLKIMDASSAITFDSTMATGGVPIALHTIAATGGPFVYSWPAFAGKTIYVIPITFDSFVNAAIDYALGYPRVTYVVSASASVSLVVVA